MKSSTLFSSFVGFNFLALNSLSITAAIALLAQTNTLQVQSKPQQKLTSLQAPKLEMTDTLGWLVFIGLPVLAVLLGLATLEHRRKTTLKNNRASQNNISDEENYFG